MFRFAAIATGSGVLTALLASQSGCFRAHATSAHNIPADSNCSNFKWDSNWDRRAPVPGEDGTTAKPTATRTLVLIRHGQYETWHEDREKRILTALGREQAKLTGIRLKELSSDYSVLYCSSMPRARESADIVAEILPNVPRRELDVLCEGAPIKPQPPSKHWKPDEYVRLCVYLFAFEIP